MPREQAAAPREPPLVHIRRSEPRKREIGEVPVRMLSQIRLQFLATVAILNRIPEGQVDL